ncbi:MAG: peptide chain release factor 1 [Proteobacteria bacterium]|nr:peptide chain release factor 1 [Pseudomonadota bacterium]
MLPSILKKLTDAEQRLNKLEEQMADGSGVLQSLMKEHGKLLPLVTIYREWQAADSTYQELTEWETSEEDSELRQLAATECAMAVTARDDAAARIRRLLSPEAAENRRNCFIEIRAAVGGNESCLFAADLLRLYTRLAERHQWRSELISHADGEVGGYKEVILKIVGEGAYGWMQFESGAHRVQRVPQTESQGRIHTSIVTIAVLAESEEEDDLVISPADLRIETFRASGAGGQHVNTTDSAVRMTHLPSGIVAECQDDRSQHKNREKALSVLRARIVSHRLREKQEKESSQRRSLVGSGDRSDRIRTYNFPQGRLTDHRIGLTLYKLHLAMEGEIDEILIALTKADEEDRALADG